MILFYRLIIWKGVGTANKIGMRRTGPQIDSLPPDSGQLASMISVAMFADEQTTVRLSKNGD